MFTSKWGVEIEARSVRSISVCAVNTMGVVAIITGVYTLATSGVVGAEFEGGAAGTSWWDG